MQTNTSRCLVNAVLFLGLVMISACSEDSTSTAPTDETTAYSGSNGFIIEGAAGLEELSFDATSVTGFSRSTQTGRGFRYSTTVYMKGQVDGQEFVLFLNHYSSDGFVSPGESVWQLFSHEGEEIGMEYDGQRYWQTEGTTSYTLTEERLQGSFDGTLIADGQSSTVNISGKFDVEHELYP